MPPTESHRLLEERTQQLAVSLANAERAEEALRDETRVLELLNRIGRDLSANLDLHAVLQAVTDAGTEIGAAEFGMFVSRAPAVDQSAASGRGFFAARKAIGEALAQGSLDWDQASHCDDLRADAALSHRLLLDRVPAAEPVPRSLMFIPLVSRSSDVLGALVFGHGAPAAFTGRTERILGGIAAQAAVAIDNARLYLQVTREIREQRLLSSLQEDYLRRLRSLSWRLMHAEELERKHLGRELHDRVGSNLNALLLGLALVRSELPSPSAEQVASRLADLEQTVRDTMEHVRDVLSDLRPTALDELGLVPALRHQAAVLSVRSGVEFRVAGSEPVPRMAAECEIAFFRIAQEAWANALKHGHAHHVQTTVDQKGRLVSMNVRDDGVGFDPAARQPGSPSLGLTIMRERAEAMGAALAMESSPGHGVSVTVGLVRTPAARFEPA